MMKKKVVSTILLVMMCVVLVGCNDDYYNSFESEYFDSGYDGSVNDNSVYTEWTPPTQAPRTYSTWDTEEEMESVKEAAISYAKKKGMKYNPYLNEVLGGYWGTDTMCNTALFESKEEFIKSLYEIVDYQRSYNGFNCFNVWYKRTDEDYDFYFTFIQD